MKLFFTNFRKQKNLERDYKNFNQIVEIVLQKKERGNTFYQEEKIELAIKKF